MSRTRTLGELTDDVYKRCDLEGAVSFVPLLEAYEYINQAIAAYHDLIVEIRGDSFFPETTTITTVANTQTYPVDAQFYKLLQVSTTIDGTNVILNPYSWRERPFLLDPSVGWSGKPIYYSLLGGNIEFLPVPQDAYEVTFVYIPCAARLDDPSDTFDGVNGWEIFVIDWAARKMAEKDENYELCARLDASVADMTARIRRMSKSRDVSQPARITDVTTHNVNPRLYMRRGLYR